jgi:hypothetical protein
MKLLWSNLRLFVSLVDAQFVLNVLEVALGQGRRKENYSLLRFCATASVV